MKKLLHVLLSILGFSFFSCDNPFVCKYGCPYAAFDVKGVVHDEDNQPINNIQVVVNDYDTLKTNMNGEYHSIYTVVSPCDTIKVSVEDIDGELNGGTFESAEIKEAVKPSDFKGADGEWYLGKVTRTVNVTLKQHQPFSQK